ncbi:Hypothetical predicted protein [Olea europaea subsp. europaea]|uniref:Uncharacterized protein n=1 Tax=Olea europaea subsp. europaea TaxID=158383 RepID=A0A8S0V0F5_OLEEU|nr:Hypothetical predicted protein [Olea europaea subsp. europaea]
MIVYEDDLDFIDSKNNLASEEDNILYDRYAIDGIEMGLDGHEGRVEDECEDNKDIEVDELKYSSEEELFL